ncbi:MAG: hypothetical protein Q8N51_09105, partial [Gammaproteobacteria bacterium]|nr:hypothetical protein [Gammaproteobacteria bacterium]
MRHKCLLLVAASAFAAAGFVGCGDGEEGGGGGGSGAAGGAGGTGGTGGGDGSTGCPAVTFTSPGSGATLTVSDDKDGDCTNGIQVDVTVATNAKAGTDVKLLADGAEAGAAVASG